MRTLTPVIAAIFLPVASSIRNHRSTTKKVAGVPIHNWESRHLQLKGVSTNSGNSELDWILAFDKKTSDEQLNQLCKHGVGKAVCRVMGHPSEGGTPFVTLRGTEDELSLVLESHADQILFAEPDKPVDVPEVMESKASVTSSGTPWSHGKISLSKSTYKGSGVHIFVMDTGVRSTHQDFGGRALPTLDTLVGNGEPVECNGDVTCATDYHGHGTHCAGSAGGRTFGSAPEANLYVMKVCCGQGTNVIAGMDWVEINGKRPAIMTISLAAPGVWMADKVAVDSAVDAGVTVFVGSANENEDTCYFSYGFIPSAITVGASNYTNVRADFSNWGSCNDIYAPGVDILSGWKGSDTQTATISGTSMATPLTAGVGALILEEHPSFTPQQVLDLMLERSIKGVLTDMQEGDPNKLLSAV